MPMLKALSIANIQIAKGLSRRKDFGNIQNMARRNIFQVRGDHQIFVERAGSSLAASLMESSQILKSVGRTWAR